MSPPKKIEKAVTCVVCEKQFKVQKYLTKHQRTYAR